MVEKNLNPSLVPNKQNLPTGYNNNLGSGSTDYDNNNIAYIPNNTFVNTDYNSETTPKNITINFFINF